MNKLTKQQLGHIFEMFITCKDVFNKSIQREKQQIPWSGTHTGPTYAVTTGHVGYQLDEFQKLFVENLRQFTDLDTENN